MEFSVTDLLPLLILLAVLALSIYVAVRAIKNGKVGPEYGLSLKPRPKPKDQDGGSGSENQ